jgi:hypothetical protein
MRIAGPSASMLQRESDPSVGSNDPALGGPGVKMGHGVCAPSPRTARFVQARFVQGRLDGIGVIMV